MLRRLVTAAVAIAVLSSAPIAQIQTQGTRGPGAQASVVALDSGRVSGALTGQHDDISVYRGIPYAAPPVGDLRWRPPQPVTPWREVRAATEFSPILPQRDSLSRKARIRSRSTCGRRQPRPPRGCPSCSGSAGRLHLRIERIADLRRHAARRARRRLSGRSTIA